MKNVKRIIQLGALATSMMVLAAGCGTQAQKAASASGTAGKTAVKNKELVFYSAEGFDSDIAKAFQAKTGIKVKLVDMSTGPLAAKIQAEKNNPQWDVAWFDGPSTMQSIDNQGMLEKGYVPANAANYTTLGKQLESKDNSYYPVTVTAAGAIAYNTNLVKNPADIPKDWSDLLKPQFKGQVAMNNPSISGPTFPAVFGLMNIEGNGNYKSGESFFTKLKANGLQVFDTNGPTLTNLDKGTVKFAIAQDSAIMSQINKGMPFKIVYPSSGVSTLSSNIGIDAKAPHMAAAKEFVNYVLSVEGQKVESTAKTGDANFMSIIKGAPGKPNLRPANVNWKPIDPVAGAQHENEIKTWFTQNIVQ
jgi:iron(III) transport system substrate-binding protein